MWRQLSYLKRKWTRRPRRYRRLLEAVHDRKPRAIVEVGTHNGRNASEMIETASLFTAPDAIRYYGFDLFEMLTEDDLVKEFSLRPPARADVQRRLEQTGAKIHLFQGYSRDTLKELQPQLASNDASNDASSDGAGGIDFVFLDGGHSHETIASDWEHISRVMTPNTEVVLDDYYPGDEREVQQVGCRKLVESLDKRLFEVEVLDPEDHFRKEWGVLRVRLVRIRKRPAPVPS